MVKCQLGDTILNTNPLVVKLNILLKLRESSAHPTGDDSNIVTIYLLTR